MNFILLSSFFTDSTLFVFFFYAYVDHRDLHVLTHSCLTQRSSDLRIAAERRDDLCDAAAFDLRGGRQDDAVAQHPGGEALDVVGDRIVASNRKSTRLNSSH